MDELKDILKKLKDSKLGEVPEKSTSFDEKDINSLKSQAELEALTIENKLKAEDLEGRKQDRKERKLYARIALWFLVAYMIAVLVILFLDALLSSFHLDNSVLIALITTTTANVIGIFAFVMMYLFNIKQKIPNQGV